MKSQLVGVIVLVSLAVMITAVIADPQTKTAPKTQDEKEVKDVSCPFAVKLITPDPNESTVLVDDPDGDGVGTIDIDLTISGTFQEPIRAGATGSQPYGIHKLELKNGHYVGKIKAPCSARAPYPQFFITIYDADTGCPIEIVFQGACKGHEKESKESVGKPTNGYTVTIEVPDPPGIANVYSTPGLYVKVFALGDSPVVSVTAEALQGTTSYGVRPLNRIGSTNEFDGYIPAPCAISAPYPVFNIKAKAQFFLHPTVQDQNDGYEGKCVMIGPLP